VTDAPSRPQSDALQGAPTSSRYPPPFRGAELSKPDVVALDPPAFAEVVDPKKRKWLATFAMTGNVRLSCKAVGICESTAYNWRKDPDTPFAAALEVARRMACDRIEAEIFRRGHDGVEQPVYQNGRLVGTTREYSDTLLIFFAKGLMPERYRERHEVTGPGGGPVQLARADLATLSAADLEVLERVHLQRITDGKP
jgi:hypothetical protein